MDEQYVTVLRNAFLSYTHLSYDILRHFSFERTSFIMYYIRTLNILVSLTRIIRYKESFRYWSTMKILILKVLCLYKLHVTSKAQFVYQWKIYWLQSRITLSLYLYMCQPSSSIYYATKILLWNSMRKCLFSFATKISTKMLVEWRFVKCIFRL